MARGSIRRSIAMPRLWELAFSGIPITSAINQVRREGLGFKSQEMFKDYNRMQQHVRYVQNVPELKPYQRPPRRLVPELRLGADRKYMTIMKVSSLDPATGEQQENFISFYHDSLMSGAEMEGEAGSIFNPETYESEEGTIQFQSVVTYHHLGKTW